MVPWTSQAWPSGWQRAEGFIVMGSTVGTVRQELANRAIPRSGANSRIFMGVKGVGDA